MVEVAPWPSWPSAMRDLGNPTGERKELLDVVREAVVVGWKGELQEFGWDLRIKRPHFGETTTFWGNN